MKRISQFWGRIGTKLHLALGCAVLLILVSNGVAIWHFENSSRHAYQVRDESVPVLEAAWQVYGDAQILRRMGMARLGAIDISDVDAVKQRISEGVRAVSSVSDLQPVAEQVEASVHEVAGRVEDLLTARGELAGSAEQANDVTTRVDLAYSAHPELLTAIVLIRAALRTDDSSRLAKLRAELDDLMSRPVVVPSGYSVLFQEVFDIQGEYLQWADRVADAESSLEADALAMGVALDDLLVAARHESSGTLTASVERFDRGRIILLAVSVTSVLAALAVAWLWVGRVILSRLSDLSERMRGMARGEFDEPVPATGDDEIGELADALEAFRNNALEVQRLNVVEQMADELQGKNKELEIALADLRTAQEQIVMQEKLAGLGELTAGVAHEIKNPLNFVQNFSESSKEMVEELMEILDRDPESISGDDQLLIQELSENLDGNMDRIIQHGGRANRIVQDMLLMSRERSEERATDINALLDEHARLAYHSARATDSSFQLHIAQDLDPAIGEIVINPQDIGRVFLNIIGNACYATDEKRRARRQSGNESYMPTLWLNTQRGPDNVKIRIRDNGDGIPADVADRIFNPFFTTKPTDRGTGLGLAISNDLVRQHGGSIEVKSQSGEFTEMTVTLPIEPTQPDVTALDREVA